MKKIVIGGVLILVLIVVSVFVVRWVTAPARGKLQQRETVQSGQFRTAAYEEFFDLCAAVQTDEVRLSTQRELLEVTTDADRRAQLEANVAALVASRAEKIYQYNATAEKNVTRGQFRSWKLPPRLNVHQEVTTCA